MNTWPALRARSPRKCRSSNTYFQSGGLVDAVLNIGLPAPIDVQVAGIQYAEAATRVALDLASKIKQIPGVADVFIPQDVDYPALN